MAGLRIGELARLRRKRLDLAAEVVAEMHDHLYLGPPKTTAGRRRVGLPRVLVEALQEHLAGRSVEPDGFVVARANGAPLRTANLRTRIWRPATRAAGLEGLGIHDLQHTAVARWIPAGAGPKEVATRAGHSSVSFTLDHYGHLDPEAGPGVPGPSGPLPQGGRQSVERRKVIGLSRSLTLVRSAMSVTMARRTVQILGPLERAVPRRWRCRAWPRSSLGWR